MKPDLLMKARQKLNGGHVNTTRDVVKRVERIERNPAQVTVSETVRTVSGGGGGGAGATDLSGLTYTPSDVTDWTGGVDPGHADDAMDQLAARTQVEYILAASNSSARDKAMADVICDGTADDDDIDTWHTAVASAGGKLILAPGTYNFAAMPTAFTENVPFVIEGYGATINLAATVTGFKVNQTSGAGIRGVRLRGLRIIGSGKAGSCVGIELEDTNNSRIEECYISACGTGILMESNGASNFVEGTLIDDVLIRDCATGWKLDTISGTGSFMQTTVRHLKIAGCTTGVDLQSGGILMRSHVAATVWIDSSETAWNIDGTIEDSHLYMGVEGVTGATSNTALVVGTNAGQTEQAFLHLFMTGAIATQINNAGTKDFVVAISGTTSFYSTAFARSSYRRIGDAADRFRISLQTNGGQLDFGDGTAAVDTNLKRIAANVLATDDKFDPASFNMPNVSGTPVDGDVVGGAANGDVILSTGSAALYGRIAGSWVSLSGGGGPATFDYGKTIAMSVGGIR